MSAEDYDAFQAELGPTSAGSENVQQCHEDIASGAKVGAVAGAAGGAVDAALTAGVANPAAAAVVVASATLGGAAAGAVAAGMTSDACAAALQDIGDAVSSMDPAWLEDQMEKISMSTALKALEGR